MNEADSDVPLPSRRTILAILAAGLGTYTVADALGILGASPAHAAAPFAITNWWGPVPAYNDTFTEHVNRPVPSPNPGTDWGMPAGTSVRTPHDGYLYIDQVGSLWQANIVHPTGWRSELLHVSGFVGAQRTVARGDIVALSGGLPGTPGAGPSNGSHLHWSLKTPQGTNVDPLLYVNDGTQPPPAIPTEDEDMPYLLYNPSSQHADRRAYYTPGSPLHVIDINQAIVAAGLMKQFKRVTSTTADADVTTQVTDTMWDLIVALEGTA